MKKTLTIVILCISLVIGNFAINTEVATATDSRAGIIVRPMFTYIDAFNNSFNITTAGKAVMFCFIAVSNADQATVSVYLEKYNNGTWSPVSSWYSSEYETTTSVNASYYVSSGQYRMRTTGCAYNNGALVELVSYTSYVLTY